MGRCDDAPDVDDVDVEASLNSLYPEVGRVENSRLVSSELSLFCAATPPIREG